MPPLDDVLLQGVHDEVLEEARERPTVEESGVGQAGFRLGKVRTSLSFSVAVSVLLPLMMISVRPFASFALLP